MHYHKSVVLLKIHPMHHGLYFHPLLLGFLFEKGKNLLTKGTHKRYLINVTYITIKLILNALVVSTINTFDILLTGDC